MDLEEPFDAHMWMVNLSLREDALAPEARIEYLAEGRNRAAAADDAEGALFLTTQLVDEYVRQGQLESAHAELQGVVIPEELSRTDQPRHLAHAAVRARAWPIAESLLTSGFDFRADAAYTLPDAMEYRARLCALLLLAESLAVPDHMLKYLALADHYLSSGVTLPLEMEAELPHLSRVVEEQGLWALELRLCPPFTNDELD